MTASNYHPWLHRVAVLTAITALLPIGMGALVTTTDSGMAFPDWPTSDGQGMFEYPWLQSVGEKFLEHGHRLAGIVIGIASIALCGVAAAIDRRVWVKAGGALVLLSVITQGILGGQRVLLDARGLAFVHGSFAALVFALMATIAVVTSRGWQQAGEGSTRFNLGGLRGLALTTSTTVFIQYLLGGLLRHQGRVLTEHLVFAFVAAALVIWLAMSAMATGIQWFKGPAAALAGLTIVQLMLGGGAWVTKFGHGGYVAVYGSPLQVVVRTSHVLVGMLLFATTIVLTVRIARIAWGQTHGLDRSSDLTALPGMLPAAGGAR